MFSSIGESPDIASYQIGGRIDSIRNTKEFVGPSTKLLNLIPIISGKTYDPNRIITDRPKPYTPGDCYPFLGNKGTFIIKLPKPAIVSGITIEHIKKYQDPEQNVNSAPKMISIYVRSCFPNMISN